MPNKGRPIQHIEQNKSDPMFEVCRLKTASGWYVRVSWQHGQVEHVSGFRLSMLPRVGRPGYAHECRCDQNRPHLRVTVHPCYVRTYA